MYETLPNWGNDDTSFDDVYFLGGFPWDVPQRYQEEAAIYQMNKVRTPTHIVFGVNDVRVAVAEAYLLDHALHALDVPSTLLIFPGEGHELDKNPWHGKIKVWEELKWLEKYARWRLPARNYHISMYRKIKSGVGNRHTLQIDKNKGLKIAGAQGQSRYKSTDRRSILADKTVRNPGRHFPQARFREINRETGSVPIANHPSVRGRSILATEVEAKTIG